MPCYLPKPIFPTPLFAGLKEALPLADGYSVVLRWAQAMKSTASNLLGYNIYYSNNIDNVFIEGPKLFTEACEALIVGFNSGDIVFFAVRAVEYEPTVQQMTGFVQSPICTTAYSYPETALLEDIIIDSLELNVIDASEFPSIGAVVIGVEIIAYDNVDYTTNTLYVASDGRGFYGTTANLHMTDGYDGYDTWSPVVRYFEGFTEDNLTIVEAQPRFDLPEFPFTIADGYRQITADHINTNLSAEDMENEGFPRFPHSGYHRTDMEDLFSGNCVGSYIGGEYGCADGGRVRGLNIQEQNMQRQEMALNVTGQPTVLLSRRWTGITCNCVRLNSGSPDGRCPICFSTGFVGGYEQYYNPRRSDRRIMVRYSPTMDDVTLKEPGLSQGFNPVTWTLAIPTIKDRDILIRYSKDNVEEFRYEVLTVTRNITIISNTGKQDMQLQRLDKTSIVYQWRAVKDLSMYPSSANTSFSTLRGHGPHMHVVAINESNLTVNGINGTTSVVAGHSHPIINGQVMTVLGHTHTIIL